MNTKKRQKAKIKTSGKVAVITGADRGIGFAVSRELGLRGHKIILTSPDRVKGEMAAAELAGEGMDVVYHKLDVVSDRDIRALHAFILKKFNHADILINNAGVLLGAGRSRIEGLLARRIKNVPPEKDFGEGPGVLDIDISLVRATLEVNTLGPLKMCQVFVPLMMKSGYGRVVNVSSSLGQLETMTDEDKVPDYQISKTALNAVTRLVADAAGKNVLVNSVCPGWTQTELGGPEAPQSPQQAAQTIVWLAELPDNGPTGGFFQNKKRIKW